MKKKIIRKVFRYLVSRYPLPPDENISLASWTMMMITPAAIWLDIIEKMMRMMVTQ